MISPAFASNHARQCAATRAATGSATWRWIRAKSVTLKWTVFPLRAQSTYWDLVNLIRKRWNNNYTVQGPLDWIDMKDPLSQRPGEAKAAYLQRKRLNVMLLSPWLDYDPGRHDRVWSRDEYKEAALGSGHKR